MKQEIEIKGLPEGRKIVQFQDSPDTENHQGYITALCDDGSLWSFSSGSWSMFPLIPIPVKPEKIQPRRIVLEETNEERRICYGEWYESQEGKLMRWPYGGKTDGKHRVWREVTIDKE